MLLPVLAAGIALLGGGASKRPRGAAPAHTVAAVAPPRHARRPARSAAPAQAPAVAAGSLPQTHAFPSATSAPFMARMAALWAGVVSGASAPALPAFFPRQAYVQLKAIPSAGSDWSGQLVAEYALDIAAAHALLGAAAAGAQLVAVNVPTSYAHWVEPGVCYNGIGYWEVPNARVVYRQGGACARSASPR